jgi:DNA-binding transcriptional ArsR family regulator
MTADASGTEPTALAPDEAFAVLGDGTRVQVLRALGDVDGALSFSELYDRVDIRDSGNFTYHLEKLQGHFVRKTEEGYALRQAGRRVVEAVLSGAVTDAPVLEPTAVDAPCPHCGGGTEVSYREERLLWRCRECPGSVAGLDATSAAFGTLPSGTIDLSYLPSAGMQDRTPEEMLEASDTWRTAERVALANGVCPRCSGTVDHSLLVCEDHDAGGVCEECHNRYAVRVHSRCTICTHQKRGPLMLHLLADPRFRAAFDRRGIDVFAPSLDETDAFAMDEEELLGTDPFRARISYTIDGERVALTVDDDLRVVDVTA